MHNRALNFAFAYMRISQRAQKPKAKIWKVVTEEVKRGDMNDHFKHEENIEEVADNEEVDDQLYKFGDNVEVHIEERVSKEVDIIHGIFRWSRHVTCGASFGQL